MRRYFWAAAVLTVVTGCTHSDGKKLRAEVLKDVYVQEYAYEDKNLCQASDVNLNHSAAAKFFERSRIIDSREVHDHYDIAPCHAEGTLKYQSKPCKWTIYAGGIGYLNCPQGEWYFVCDGCKDIFGYETP